MGGGIPSGPIYIPRRRTQRRAGEQVGPRWPERYAEKAQQVPSPQKPTEGRQTEKREGASWAAHPRTAQEPKRPVGHSPPNGEGELGLEDAPHPPPPQPPMAAPPPTTPPAEGWRHMASMESMEGKGMKSTRRQDPAEERRTGRQAHRAPAREAEPYQSRDAAASP